MSVDLLAVLDGPLTRAADEVAAALGDARRVAVAFSGGVDSSVTTALVARALGPDAVVAVLGVSPSLAAAERTAARVTAEQLSVRLVEVHTQEMADPRYVANAGDRCYFCKHELYSRAFLDVVGQEDVDLLVNGDTADDLARGDRPGRRAATELGVRSPLAEAGIGKPTVRALARALGLEVWDKPAAPCLASRIPVHRPVTLGALTQVEQAESRLRSLGLRELRVRHLGTRARLELSPDGHRALGDERFAADVRAELHRSGFADVEIADVPLRRD